MSETKPEMMIEGEIVKSTKQVDRDGREYRLVVSAVIIPRPKDSPDLQKDWTDEAEIEDACHEFMIHLQKSEFEADKEKGESGLSYRHQRMISSDDARIVENWRLRKDEEWNGKMYPNGTWMVAARVYKESLFKEIDEGLLRGCSVEGSAFYKLET